MAWQARPSLREVAGRGKASRRPLRGGSAGLAPFPSPPCLLLMTAFDGTERLRQGLRLNRGAAGAVLRYVAGRFRPAAQKPLTALPSPNHRQRAPLFWASALADGTPFVMATERLSYLFTSIRKVFRKIDVQIQRVMPYFWGVISALLGRRFRLLGRHLTSFGASFPLVAELSTGQG